MNPVISRTQRLDQTGFSLVELLIVILLSTVILTAMSMLLRSGLQASTGIQLKAATQEDARLALQVMTAEIGMASYNPGVRDKEPAFWVTNTCASCPDEACRLRRGIPEAMADSITVTMATGPGVNGSNWIGDDPSEVIRYVYDAANQRITRQTNCGGGAQSFLGDDGSGGRPKETRVVNADLGLPVFRYFNAQGAETADIARIRRVEVTLAVQTDQIDPTSGQRRNMIYSTSIIMRNHAITGL